MDISEWMRQYGQNPQQMRQIQQLIQSSEGQQLLRILREKGAAAQGNRSQQYDEQTAAQLLRAVAADEKGRLLLQQLAEKLKR